VWLAVATHTAPAVWLAETDEILATAVDVLEEMAKQARG
jgi:hypothetical protein